MLSFISPILPSIPVSTKRKFLPLQNPIFFHHNHRITNHPPPASFSGMSQPPISNAFQTNSNELKHEEDFNSIISPQNYLYICGFGSLLSEKSARTTFPNLKNFRLAFLKGFRRVFAHIAPIFYERGIAKEETKEVSSLSVEPCEGEGLIVTVFGIDRSEIVPENLDGSSFTDSAVVCARYSDEEYFQIRCKGNKDIYFQNYGRYNIHKIWRDDILPCRVYLRHCVLAAKNLGEAAYDNFLDHTFLSDRKTTIREYLSSTGSGIMEEEPPEALRIRYGG